MASTVPATRPSVTGRPYLDAVLEGGPGVDRRLAWAHRGGVHHPDLVGLENTMTAFRHAVGLGYGYLETDVHLTADGELVAFHDDVLDRVTDATGRIGTLRLAEVRQARIGGREHVPTLAEVVEELPGVRLNIDLKSAAAVRPLADFVLARGLTDRVCVGSFSRSRTRAFRRLTRGGVATAAAPVEVGAFLAASALPGARRALGGADALQVPARRGRVTVVTADVVRRVHAAGRHVHVWTVDEPAEMHRLLDLGVDGLFTDRTDLLKSTLVERGAWW